jgi:hypothetical protein
MTQLFTRFAIAGLLMSPLLLAETYKVRLTDTVQVGQTQLMPGRYLLEVNGSNAVLKDEAGKAIDANAKVEQTNGKASDTSIEVNTAQPPGRLVAVTPRGSHVRVVFQ